MSPPTILLSGFADEAANQKTLDQQFCAMAALGLRYFSIRFVDVGNGVQHAMALSESETQSVRQKMQEYGLSVSSLGSPIGKIKLRDIDDGTATKYRPFAQYLTDEVSRACDLANRLGAKLIRGFSFYHPKGAAWEPYLDQATDQVGQITEVCKKHGLVFGLEVEANLVGQNGFVLANMHRAIANTSLLLIFDGGNLVMQGFSQKEIFQQYLAMKPGLGWMHIKDVGAPRGTFSTKTGHVDEEAVRHFVPADCGDAGHEQILADFVGFLPELQQRLTSRGVVGVFVDLEPHLKGGGQFGGFSGPDGFGVALRAFCGLCDRIGIGYHLTDFADIQADRGY